MFKLLSIALVLIVGCLACNKTSIEEVKFPKNVELVVGQYCFPKVVLDEYEYSYMTTTTYTSYSSSNATVIINGDTVSSNPSSSSSSSSSYHNKKLNTYTFTSWISNHPEIAEVRGDTLKALTLGECELTTLYHDDFGDHEATCHIKVSDLQVPTPYDTIYAHIGDTLELFSFSAPSNNSIHYELEYGINGHSSFGVISRFYSSTHFGNSPIVLSPLSTYDLTKVIEAEVTSIHIFCESLNINVRIPIVILPSDGGGQKPN